MGRSNKIRTIAIAVAIALGASIPIALAQSTGKGEGAKPERRWGGRGHRMGGDFFGSLDLSDAQKAQMKQIRESHSQTIRPLMEEIRAKRRDIHKASQNGATNEALVTQKLTEIAPLEARLISERSKVHEQMLAVLTADQKAKLEQSREQFKTRRSEGRKHKQQSN